jgi:hypothetical protein
MSQEIIVAAGKMIGELEEERMADGMREGDPCPLHGKPVRWQNHWLYSNGLGFHGGGWRCPDCKYPQDPKLLEADRTSTSRNRTIRSKNQKRGDHPRLDCRAVI